MQIFVTIILASASLLSIARFSLLPRKFAAMLAIALAMLPPLAHSRLAVSSLTTSTKAFESMEFLQNSCVLIIVQEILVVIIGFSLLEDHVEERTPRKWKFAVFVPSILLPPALMYLQMWCFNHFLNVPFRVITTVLTLLMPCVVLGIGEILRRCISKEDLLLKMLALEWCLLLLGMFVPLTATASFAPSGQEAPFRLMPLLWLAAPVFASAFVHLIIRMTRNHCHHVDHYSNT